MAASRLTLIAMIHQRMALLVVLALQTGISRSFSVRSVCRHFPSAARFPSHSLHSSATDDERLEIVYYTGEGQWDDSFIETQQANVPWVRIVESMPPPLSVAATADGEDAGNPPLEANGANCQFYLLRHGQSTANVDEVISSDRWSLAYSDKHGLTNLGYQQGRDSARQLWEILQSSAKQSNNRIVFVSSPFARARQTAKACLDGIPELMATEPSLSTNWQVEPTIQIRNELIERYFGRLDGQAIETYSYVWPLDRFNVTHTAFDVESVAAVCTRIRELVLDLQADCASDETMTHYVLVSHADVLQIAQLYAAHADNVGEFSSFRFQNGEIREMLMDTTALPDPQPLQKPDRSTRQG